MTFLEYVEQIAGAYQAARTVRTGEAAAAAVSRPAGAPCVALIMPHPDDECITGALALRLQQECGARVVNIAVTLGSNRARKEERRAELCAACAHLGFELEILGESALGLDGVSVTTRTHAPEMWHAHVHALTQVLARLAPRVVIAPHDNDWHPTHIGVHWLAVDALAAMSPGWSGTFVETEFWFPMAAPNLAVETSVADTAVLINATACHRGEVERNPYHLRLPAWMMDNVRRMELLGGKGSAVPDVLFATLYRVRRVMRGHLQPVAAEFQFVAAGDHATLSALLNTVEQRA